MNAISLQELPRAEDIALDRVVVMYTLAAAVAIGLVLGLIPVVATISANVIGVLREEGRSATTGRGTQSFRRAIGRCSSRRPRSCCWWVRVCSSPVSRRCSPSIQGSGLEKCSRVPYRSPSRDMTVPTRGGASPTKRCDACGCCQACRQPARPTAFRLATARVRQRFSRRATQAQPGESLLAPAEVRVSQGYFEAIGARLVAGRFFNERDAAKGPRVIMVDDRLARRFWPNQNPLGRRMYRPSDDGDNLTAVTEKTEFLTVVGVVAEMKLRSLTDGDNRVGAYFIPLAQEPQGDLTFVLRVDGDPAALSGALRREVVAIDAQLPVFEMRPMSYWTNRSLASRRSPALFRSSSGSSRCFCRRSVIYGVLAYLVTQRTKEIGIRVALGSSASAVFKLVLREGVLLVGIGLLVGGLGSFMLRRALEGQLFGVTASNPVVLVLVTAMLTVVALAACAVPARRATKIDPLIALND